MKVKVLKDGYAILCETAVPPGRVKVRVDGERLAVVIRAGTRSTRKSYREDHELGTCQFVRQYRRVACALPLGKVYDMVEWGPREWRNYPCQW